MWRRPAAGSSSSSSIGSTQSARAISTMRCWPSDSEPASWSIWSARPTRSIWRAASASSLASSARSSRSMLAIAPAWPRRCAPIATFSSTVMSGTSLTCWKVRAMPSLTISCGGALSTFLPRTEIEPAVAGSTPVIRLKVVLLPAPFGPISATISRRLDVEGDVVDRDHAAELLARLLDLEQHAGLRRRARALRQRRATVSGLLPPARSAGATSASGQTPVGASCSSATSRMPNTMVSSWP